MLRTPSILIILLTSVVFIAAQTPSPTPVDDSDAQSWNDVSITKPLNKKVDLVFPFSLRFGKNIKRVQEIRGGVSIAFKPHSRFTLTPGYSFIRARNSLGSFTRENRLLLAATYRFPVTEFGLSHRSLFEYRIRPSGKTWRYRPSITVDKPLPERWVEGMKLYATTEPFYDSAAGRFSRHRLTLGVNKGLSKHLSLDLFYLRQDDSNSHPSVIHALGTGWRIRL